MKKLVYVLVAATTWLAGRRSFSSAGDGVIFESQLDKIFPFVEDLILYH